MAKPQPDPDPDGCWPSCGDEQPGISIRPLSHADLAALLAHLDQHDPDQHPDDAGSAVPAPVVAVRVRASVGRPGASAQTEYRRRRASEWAAWTRSLPWRATAVLASGVTAWLAATQVATHLSVAAGAAVAAGLGWLLRFRSSPDTVAWRRGAAGERRTARLLAPLERRGWAVLHDLAISGSKANIDHLVIGPGGVVIDSKQYRGAAAAGLLRAAVARPPPAGLRASQGAVGGRPGRCGPGRRRRPGRRHHGRARRQRPVGTAAGRRRHRRARPAGARSAAGAATGPWARAGGLASRPSSAAVPRRRLTASTDRRFRRDWCLRGFTWAVA
jgi:hypothetical protein